MFKLVQIFMKTDIMVYCCDLIPFQYALDGINIGTSCPNVQMTFLIHREQTVDGRDV